MKIRWRLKQAFCCCSIHFCSHSQSENPLSYTPIKRFILSLRTRQSQFITKCKNALADVAMRINHGIRTKRIHFPNPHRKHRAIFVAYADASLSILCHAKSTGIKKNPTRIGATYACFFYRAYRGDATVSIVMEISLFNIQKNGNDMLQRNYALPFRVKGSNSFVDDHDGENRACDVFGWDRVSGRITHKYASYDIATHILRVSVSHFLPHLPLSSCLSLFAFVYWPEEQRDGVQ